VADVSDTIFADAPDLLSSSSTGVTTLKLFNAVQQLLIQYPQHATPTVYNNAGTNTPNLRVRILITHLEIVYRWVGAQSNVLAAGDLYNTGRCAWYIEGTPFDGTGATSPVSYLTSVMGGTNITDVERVLHDEPIGLSSTAYDSANGYNVPRTICKRITVPVNKTFTFFSTTAAGVAWKTEMGNMLLDHVSDSTVAPHPSFSHNTRIFMKFLSR
jgi:hypothetical protein